MSLSTPARGALPALPGWAVFFLRAIAYDQRRLPVQSRQHRRAHRVCGRAPAGSGPSVRGAKGGGWPRRGHRQVGLAVLRPRRHVALREPRPRDRRCDSRGCPLAVLRGLAVLFCGLAVYMVCASPGTDASRLLAGIGLGIVLNGVFSFAAQRAFDSGSYFSLYSLFPKSPLPFAPPGRSGAVAARVRSTDHVSPPRPVPRDIASDGVPRLFCPLGLLGA